MIIFMIYIILVITIFVCIIAGYSISEGRAASVKVSSGIFHTVKSVWSILKGFSSYIRNM